MIAAPFSDEFLPPYFKEIIHNNKRRAPWNDYHARQIYMVTVTKAPESPAFGRLMNVENPTDAYVELSSAGEVIRRELDVTPEITPEVRLIDYVIMPDHFHAIVFVTVRMEKTLGDVIRGIKSAATGKIRKGVHEPDLTVFEDSFHDRIITRSGQLDAVKLYVFQNPYRLAVRQMCPEYFRRVNGLTIDGKEVSAYGNMQLLDNPFKENVVVHRAETQEQREKNRMKWLYVAANGGVLVSPFISPAERKIREEAETLDGSIILLTSKPFGDRDKPMGRDFALCEKGRLLIIALPVEEKALSRNTCLMLNSLAEVIARGEH